MNLPNWFIPQHETPQQIPPSFSWDGIDCVFLDMDGTLLDKYYDDYFWEHFVPEVYATKNQVDITDARKLLLATYRSVENTLQWTDLDYWSDRLGLDIVALKREISHLVNVHPHIIEYFEYMHRIGKKLYLITNAHPRSTGSQDGAGEYRPPGLKDSSAPRKLVRPKNSLNSGTNCSDSYPTIKSELFLPMTQKRYSIPPKNTAFSISFISPNQAPNFPFNFPHTTNQLSLFRN